MIEIQTQYGSRLGRIDVLDQLRGAFVVLAAIAFLIPLAAQEWGVDHARVRPLQPSIWHGITIYDTVRLGFLFLTGAASSISISIRRQNGERTSSILSHSLLYSLFIFIVGLFIDGGLLDLQWPLRLCGCFQQIAVCKLACSVIELLFDQRTTFILACILLVNGGLAYEIGAEEVDTSVNFQANSISDPFGMNENLAARIDQRFLPGRKYFGLWDPQGIFVTVLSLAITLFGNACATLIRNSEGSKRWVDAWGRLAFGGLALIQGGLILSSWEPLNAWLLTPPTVIVIVGDCLLAIGLLTALSRLKFAKPALGLLARIGQKGLAIMVSLHLIEHFASSLLTAVGDRFDLPTNRGHTLIAVLTLALLVRSGAKPRSSADDEI